MSSYQDTIAGRQVETIKKGLAQYDHELEWCVKSVTDFMAKEDAPKGDVIKFRRFITQLIERERVWQNWMLDANKILVGLPMEMFEEAGELGEDVLGEIEDVRLRIEQLLMLRQNVDTGLMEMK